MAELGNSSGALTAQQRIDQRKGVTPQNILKVLGIGLLGGAGPQGIAAGQNIIAREEELRQKMLDDEQAALAKQQEMKKAAAEKTIQLLTPVLQSPLFEKNVPEDQRMKVGQIYRDSLNVLGVPGDEIPLPMTEAKEGKTRAVTTIGEDGREVTRIVADVAGQEFPTPESDDTVTYQNPNAPSKLVSVRKGSPREDQLLQKGWIKAPVRQVTNASGIPSLTTKSKGGLEDTAIKASTGVARLNTIKDKFRGDFLTVTGKAKAAGLALAEKFNVDISPKNKEFLEDFTDFTVSSIRNINDYIKEVTGAQMSEFEAKRLRRGVPDPGDGVFGGQSPTQFKTTLDNVVRDLSLLQARAMIMRRKGIDYDFNAPENKDREGPISLSQTRQIINQRANEIGAGLIAQGKDIETARREAQIQVQREFGMIE